MLFLPTCLCRLPADRERDVADIDRHLGIAVATGEPASMLIAEWLGDLDDRLIVGAKVVFDRQEH